MILRWDTSARPPGARSRKRTYENSKLTQLTTHCYIRYPVNVHHGDRVAPVVGILQGSILTHAGDRVELNTCNNAAKPLNITQITVVTLDR